MSVYCQEQAAHYEVNLGLPLLLRRITMDSYDLLLPERDVKSQGKLWGPRLSAALPIL